MENEEVTLIKKHLNNLANTIKDSIPSDYGFTLLIYPFGSHKDQDELIYISDSRREDVVEAMKEWIKKTENNCGNDRITINLEDK